MGSSGVKGGQVKSNEVKKDQKGSSWVKRAKWGQFELDTLKLGCVGDRVRGLGVRELGWVSGSVCGW